MTSDLRVVDAQGLDLMKRQKDSDQEHLVLFFQREREAVDDTERDSQRSKVTFKTSPMFGADCDPVGNSTTKLFK